jgi:hypothetical protein
MKKEYQKPQLTRVNLKVEQTVLGNCKGTSFAGPPALSDCGLPVACSTTAAS